MGVTLRLNPTLRPTVLRPSSVTQQKQNRMLFWLFSYYWCPTRTGPVIFGVYVTIRSNTLFF